MRIGIISWDFDPPRGGLGRAMQEIARVLALGHEINHFVTEENESRLRFQIRIFRTLNQWIADHLIDCILFPVGPGGVFLLKKPPCKVIALCYHSYAQQASLVPGDEWKKIVVPFERKTFSLADGIACYAKETRTHLFERGLPNRLLTQIVQIPSISLPAPKRERGLCCSVARLDGRKGIRLLLEAWPSVEQHVPYASLVIVGDGPDRKEMDQRIARLQHVRRVSNIDQAELFSLVARSEVAVCPSYLEGFGLAAYEAMALGTAVVACNTDGLASLVTHEQSGLLADPHPEALAAAIVRLLTDNALRNRLSTTAPHMMQERFSPGRAIKELQMFLNAVCFSGRNV